MHIRRFLFIPFLAIFWLLMSYIDADSIPMNTDPFIVVLDAGHGGHDPGNLGNGYMEKNIALNIVLEIGKWLEQQPNIKVIYTRKDDSFVDLYLRGKIANEAKADLFVSVHCDSHSSDAHGAGTFVLGLHANEQNFEIAKKENSVIYLEDDYETRYAEYDINSPESIIGLTIMQEEFLDQSIMLAKLMQDEFSDKLNRTDRKVKQAGFIVLHQTFMPSVLVETGFLTNKNEGSYLNSTKGQLEMGQAIAKAILTYKANITSQPGSLLAATANASVSNNPGSAGVEKKAKQPADSVGNEIAVLPPKKETALREGNAENTPKVEAMETELKATQTVEKQEPPATEVAQISESELPEPSTDNKEPEKTQATQAPETQKEIPVELPVTDSEKTDAIIFKVQLMASSKDLPLRPDDFNGLSRLSKEPYKNLYRYLYGHTSSYKEAQMLKSNADIKGYPSSYIVAYKDGLRIPMAEALKYVRE